MKIIVKRKEWHRIIGGDLHEEETTREFVDIQKGNYWFDYGEVYESSDRHIKGALPIMVNFSFRVKEVN